MDKEIIYGRIYGFLLTRFGHYPPPIALPRSQYSTEKNDFWTNLRICSYCVRLLPPPPHVRLAGFRARRVNIVGCAE